MGWAARANAIWDSMEAMANERSSWVARAMRHKIGADPEPKVYFRVVGGIS